jgi:hypothetical protein
MCTCGHRAGKHEAGAGACGALRGATFCACQRFTSASPVKVPKPWREGPGGMLEEGWYVSDDQIGRLGPFASSAAAQAAYRERRPE